jgi:anti-sigma B factor antagonist
VRVTASGQRDIRAGVLSIRSETVGETRRIVLSGELDLANAAALESELDEALAGGDSRVVVDMSALTFIDSTGLALLVGAVTREGGEHRLEFVPSTALAVTRVMQVTGLDERLPLARS